MALNQGIGAGDPDNRLPPQQLRIMLPRYSNPIQIIGNTSHINSFVSPSGIDRLKSRRPLTGGRFDGLLHRLRGSR